MFTLIIIAVTTLAARNGAVSIEKNDFKKVKFIKRPS